MEITRIATSTLVERNEAWCEVGRRLLEHDPEMFARILTKTARYVEVLSDSTFSDAVVVSILLEESKTSV